MIFKWYSNSNNIFSSHRLNEEGQVNSKVTQEIYFIRYLLGLNYSKDQMYQFWLSIENGTAKSFEYDPEEQKTLFEKQYNAAILRGVLNEIEYDCNIYQEEISWLNSLAAPLWFRQYIFGMYVLYKSMKKKYSYVEYKKKWCSYVLKQCKNQFQYKRKSETISKWNRDCGLPMKLYPYDNKVFFSFKDIQCHKENIVAENISIENFDEYFNLLEEKTFICPQCGEKMELNEHSKRKICEKCWYEAEKTRKRQVWRDKHSN